MTSKRTYLLQRLPATAFLVAVLVLTSCDRTPDDAANSPEDPQSDSIRHQVDTSGGQSGSGFYHYTDPSCSGCGFGPYVVGMHRAGLINYNEARRYTPTVYSFTRSYSSDY